MNINPSEIRAIVAKWTQQGRITSAKQAKATVKQPLTVPTAKCDQCGAEFIPLNNRNRRCGPVCAKRGALARRRQRGGFKPLGDERNCEQCGTTFRQGSIWQRHCKPLCTRRARARREHQSK